MLQQNGRFWSRISWQRTMWQHYSIRCLDPSLFLHVLSTEISIEWTALLWCYDIIKNATEELKRLPQNSFQECVQHLYSRWKKCIVTKVDYFEGNAVYILYSFVFLSNKVIPGTFDATTYYVLYLSRRWRVRTTSSHSIPVFLIFSGFRSETWKPLNAITSDMS